jgi:tripartite-type tricarboxylate transporter receptor subunit TctC
MPPSWRRLRGQSCRLLFAGFDPKMKTRNPPTHRWLAAVAFSLFSALLGPSAQAQGTWPEKPIKVILPFPPGGPSDITMRLAADKLQISLKQPIVIENRPGAGGNLGTAELTRAPADGHTFLFGTDTLVTVNPHVYKTLGFKVEDLIPVTIVSRFSQTLVCNPALGVKTLKELVAKARSEKLSYASGGAGVPGHLSMELLQSMAGFDMAHIPYKGPAPATQDVLGNQVPCGLLAGPTVLPHVKAGKLVALGVSGSQRSPTLPDVPTMAEAGVAGYEANFTLVLFAMRGTPAAIVERMRVAVIDAMKAGEVVERLKASDQLVVGSTTEQASATLAADSRKWGEVARRIKLGLD